MQITKKLFISIIAATVLLLQGCLITPSSVVKKESFDGKKQYALFTIMAPETISNKSGSRNSSLAGLIKSAKADSGFSKDSNDIFSKTYPKAIESLNKSPRFKLVSGKTLHRNKAYKKLKSDEPPSFLSFSYHLAKGYKYFDGEKKYAAAIKSMGVDGAISVVINYSYGTAGFNLGFIEAGKQRAYVMINVTAFDRNGETIWRDTVEQESKDYIGVIASSANFKELEPLLIEAVESGMIKVMDNFEKKMKGDA